ncbi:hypothetical protein P8452_44069 [Trifolium repens]|nr:hypothetical protein P8452_44069 [Trifolium repens]
MMSTLMHHNSGFGWDSTAKTVTVPEEVWKDYLKYINNGLKVPQGKYFLVDCGFPNRRKFLAPYRVEPTDESSSSSTVLPNHEDNNYEPIVQTQEQEREDANLWRTSIGSNMWRNAT